ncbi:MAG: hypothetical protein WCL38_05035, partial [Actinomycetota bacterium]
MSIPQLKPWKAIAVYCGSAKGVNPAYSEAASALGRVLVRRELDLVYGGGSIGLMGVVATSV